MLSFRILTGRPSFEVISSCFLLTDTAMRMLEAVPTDSPASVAPIIGAVIAVILIIVVIIIAAIIVVILVR